MGTVDLELAADLRRRLGLRRAVETGTYRGVTASALATVFDVVVTIELSTALHERAVAALGYLKHVTAVQGNSVEVLRALPDPEVATLYYLDGHWSAGQTERGEKECPILDEIAAIGRGNPKDCIIVDDARLFASAPPPPMDSDQWPTLMEVVDAVRATHPRHVVTVLDDQIVAVPQAAKAAIDAYGARISVPYRDRYRAAVVGLRGLLLTKRGLIGAHIAGRNSMLSRRSRTGA